MSHIKGRTLTIASIRVMVGDWELGQLQRGTEEVMDCLEPDDQTSAIDDVPPGIL